jgi:hypothetical protein
MGTKTEQKMEGKVERPGKVIHVMNRRQALRSVALLMGAGLLSACAANNRQPVMQFVYPDRQGVRVQDNPVLVTMRVQNFPQFTDSAYRNLQQNARLVFFIDTPADAVADGQPIPDDPQRFVPATQPPYYSQAIALQPGVRTITAVMVDAQGNKLPQPAPVSVTVLVQPGSKSVR